jgi:hypothetical protein
MPNEARERAGNLTAALVAVAFLELLLNRLANRLFLPRSTISGESGGSSAVRVLSDSGPFLFHLTGILALLVLVMAFVGLLRRGELFPRGTRVAVTFIALVFWSLGAMAVLMGQMPPQLFVFLEISYAFLAALIAISVLGSGVKTRVKVGVTLFAAPGVLHVLAVVADRSNWLAHTPFAAVEIARVGEAILLAAAVGAPLLLPPRPAHERPWRVPLVAAVTLTAAGMTVLATRYDLAQAAALYGLRLEIPRLGSVIGLGYMLAFFGWIYTAAQLLADRGGMRLAGYGLLLLAIAGYQAASPVELGLSLVGLLALSVGELRAAPYGDRAVARVGRAEWRAYVGRLATAVGDGSAPEETRPDAVVVEDGELEVSRIRTHRRGRPVAIRLLRRRGALVELDTTLGEPGHVGPDASVERHRRWLARSPADRVALPRTKTGDATFDQKFSVHGQAPLTDAELRRRLSRQQGDGVVSLWRGTAARYLLASPAATAEAPPPFAGQVDGDSSVTTVIEIVDTLADLIDASAPQPQ